MIYQHDYTTKEQALRLKAAGLPAESADCMLQSCEVDYGKDVLVTLINESGYEGENWDYFMDKSTFPCWSYGRLIELMEAFIADDITKPQFIIVYNDHMVEDIVAWFKRVSEIQKCDFSILLPDRKPEPKKETLVENVAVRYFGSECPLDPKKEVDQYNCVECDCYFATARKSIICRKVEEG